MTAAFVLGGPEILILLILIGLPVVIVIVVLTIVKANRSSPPPTGLPPSREERLRELEALRAQELISEEEYEEKRKGILEEV